LFAKTTETQSFPSLISVKASPKFKTPTSISPLIKLVLIGATPLYATIVGSFNPPFFVKAIALTSSIPPVCVVPYFSDLDF
jgi:hypothetical protein